MPSLLEILADPKLNVAEIARLTELRDQSRADGFMLDAEAYGSALQLHTDALHGIDRCYGCGRIKPKRRRRG
jgi:hypothetical protein